MRRGGPAFVCAMTILILHGLVSTAFTQSTDPFARRFELAGEPMSMSQGDLPPAIARRLVHAFDFEDAEAAPIDMPSGFHRSIATDKGFPPYGHIRLSRASAFSGNWSFEFSLDTGSLAARVPTTVVPVLPLADYAITAMVRTEGLTESRARVIAWLNDDEGREIPGSRVQSAPIATEGAWQPVALAIAGQFPDAVDLGIELQLVQPHHYRRVIEKVEPRIEDVRGMAWFDDVSVWQVPRIELFTSSPVNVIVPPEEAELSVLVRDLTSEALTGKLTITDIDNRIVSDIVIPAANSPRPTAIDISQLPLGWYRADFELRRHENVLTRRQLDFVIAPRPGERDTRRTTRFAVDLDVSDVALHDQLTAVLLTRIGCDTACIPVWTRTLTSDAIAPWANHLRQFIDRLIDQHMDSTFVLPIVPESLAQAAQVDSSQVIELLRRDPALWRPFLDSVIISFGLQVNRWQLGDRRAEEFGWRDHPQRALADVTSALGNLIAGPTIAVPWPAVEQLPGNFTPGGLAIEVPYHLPPTSLLDSAQDWNLPGVETSVAFEALPSDAFSPRERLADLAERMLFGWRAGFDELSVSSPWAIHGDQRPIAQPDSTYLALQSFARELGGMEFVTELDLAENAEVWLLRDPLRGTGMIVAWSKQVGADPTALHVLLADGPVTTHDLFGNALKIAPGPDGHRIPLDDLPTFIHGISLGLAQFRAGFDFLPSFLEAEHRVHEHQLVLSNPWVFTIAGTLHLTPPDGWRIAPRTHEFTLAPGSQLRVPVDVVLDRSVLGGHKPLRVDVRLTADREYAFTQFIDLEVGLREVDFSAYWTLVPNETTGGTDLVISHYVTNRGERPLTLTTYLAAPGLSQRRRMIGGLEPGQTIVRHFRIENGAAALAGKVVHVGLAEQNGTARLRKALEIPLQASRLDMTVNQPTDRSAP